MTEDVPRGVAIIPGVRASRHSPDGRGVNELTSQALTDMGEGPCYHTNLAEAAPAGAENGREGGPALTGAAIPATTQAP